MASRRVWAVSSKRERPWELRARPWAPPWQCQRPEEVRGIAPLFAVIPLALLIAGGSATFVHAQTQPVTAPAQPGAVQRPGPHFPQPGRPVLPGDRRLMMPARARIGLQHPEAPPVATQQGESAAQPGVQRSPLLYSPVKPAPPAVVVAPGSTAGITAPALEVNYAGGLLSVTADKVLLSQVMQQVSQRTGIEVRGLQEVGKPVSVHFSGVPVAQGIGDLLGGSNYVVFGSLASAAEARQARVILLSATTGAQVDVGPAPAPPPPAVPATDAREARRAALLSANPVEQDAGFTQLQRLSPKEAYDELEDVIVNGDGVARLRALQYMDQDGQLDSNLVMGSLRDALNDPDSSLRDYAIQALGRSAGPEALDLLRQEMSSSDANVRLNVLEALSQREDGKSLIQQAASDPDQAVAGLANELLRGAADNPVQQPEQPGESPQPPVEVQPQPGQPEPPPESETPLPDPDPPGE